MCYIKQPVTLTELEDLAKHAVEEEEAFFKRNPHLVELYRQRLILVALCQGAALQFLDRGYGVKDFDIHFFVQRIRTSRGCLALSNDARRRMWELSQMYQ